MIEIILPGILASIQDLGREGYRCLGVGVSGAMDGLALRIANTLIGNAENAACIETTLGGFLCRFDTDCLFSVTGANAEITLDETPVPTWNAIAACAGQVLEIASPRIGMRNYIAFSGGVDAPVIMGSRATDLKGNFGGYQGRGLRQGDRLELKLIGGACDHAREFGLSLPEAGLELDEEITSVRMIPAAEWNDYSYEIQQLFLSTNWGIDQISNRVGYRLVGPSLTHGTPKELLSHGILPGTVQLPPSGQPVVQMSDANTCGGYPKLGVVIQADLWKLGQVQLGKAVRFHVVTPGQALHALRAEMSLLSSVRALSALAMNSSDKPLRHGITSVAAGGELIVPASARGIVRCQDPNRNIDIPALAAGDAVEAGQLLCYLEAGLLLLPIRSPVSGKIREFTAKDKQEVACGDPLVSLNIENR